MSVHVRHFAPFLAGSLHNERTVPGLAAACQTGYVVLLVFFKGVIKFIGPLWRGYNALASLHAATVQSSGHSQPASIQACTRAGIVRCLRLLVVRASFAVTSRPPVFLRFAL